MFFLLEFLIFLSVAWMFHALFHLRPGRNPLLPDSRSAAFLLKRLTPSLYAQYLRGRLVTARSGKSPDRFAAIQILCGTGLGLIGTLLAPLIHEGGPSPVLQFTIIFLLFATGFLYPLNRLNHEVRLRQKHMLRDLSYYLDLMILGVEAGLDYLNVLTKVLERSAPGPLKEELQTLIGQIQMGKSRSEAWKAFSERIGLPEIRSLVLVLDQTDLLGTPISETLLRMSQDIKVCRFQLAEKRAYQMPVKLLIPLLGCIFPAVFIVIFEPLILRFLRLS